MCGFVSCRGGGRREGWRWCFRGKKLGRFVPSLVVVVVASGGEESRQVFVSGRVRAEDPVCPRTGCSRSTVGGVAGRVDSRSARRGVVGWSTKATRWPRETRRVRGKAFIYDGLASRRLYPATVGAVNGLHASSIRVKQYWVLLFLTRLQCWVPLRQRPRRTDSEQASAQTAVARFSCLMRHPMPDLNSMDIGRFLAIGRYGTCVLP